MQKHMTHIHIYCHMRVTGLVELSGVSREMAKHKAGELVRKQMEKKKQPSFILPSLDSVLEMLRTCQRS